MNDEEIRHKAMIEILRRNRHIISNIGYDEFHLDTIDEAIRLARQDEREKITQMFKKKRRNGRRCVRCGTEKYRIVPIDMGTPIYPICYRCWITGKAEGTAPAETRKERDKK